MLLNSAGQYKKFIEKSFSDAEIKPSAIHSKMMEVLFQYGAKLGLETARICKSLTKFLLYEGKRERFLWTGDVGNPSWCGPVREAMRWLVDERDYLESDLIYQKRKAALARADFSILVKNLGEEKITFYEEIFEPFLQIDKGLKNLVIFKDFFDAAASFSKEVVKEAAKKIRETRSTKITLVNFKSALNFAQMAGRKVNEKKILRGGEKIFKNLSEDEMRKIDNDKRLEDIVFYEKMIKRNQGSPLVHEWEKIIKNLQNTT